MGLTKWFGIRQPSRIDGTILCPGQKAMPVKDVSGLAAKVWRRGADGAKGAQWGEQATMAPELPCPAQMASAPPGRSFRWTGLTTPADSRER
jgi:hypothetical protein